MFWFLKQKPTHITIVINPDWRIQGKYTFLKKKYKELEEKYWERESYIAENYIPKKKPCTECKNTTRKKTKSSEK